VRHAAGGFDWSRTVRGDETVAAAGAREGLDALEARLGHRFADRTLLETALQHSSYAHETAGIRSNERLEFLGDSVIALVLARALYDANPNWKEGDLTRGLHRLVDRPALSDLARRLGLGAFLRLGRTERQSHGMEKDSILADAMEAVLGAVYLDGGLDPVADLAGRMFSEALQNDAPRVGLDPKTQLQESVMARYGEFPEYEPQSDSGLEGDDERFGVCVRVRGEAWASGVGRTKRSAERAAAEAALAAGRHLSGEGKGVA